MRPPLFHHLVEVLRRDAGQAPEGIRFATETIGFGALRKLAWIGGVRRSKDFERVESFCLFVGHRRTGHTLVRALLDAHPAMVISHELNALDLVQRGPEAVSGRRFFASTRRRALPTSRCCRLASRSLHGIAKDTGGTQTFFPDRVRYEPVSSVPTGTSGAA